MMFDPFSISTGYEIIKIAKREGWLRYAVDLCRTKNRAILLGSTGAGKTQFLRSIEEIVAMPLPSAARTEFVTLNRFDLNSALFEFIDTPGQLEHRPRRDQAVKEAIKKNLRGVINFVSYGYHEYGAPPEHAVENGQARQEYLAVHREREIALLGEWAGLLSTEWVMTVVTKADIWWDSRQAVAEYYSHGPYNEALRHLFPTAHRVVRPYSSVSARFYGQVPGATSFDDSIRSSLRTELFRVLREAADQLRG